MYKMTEKVPLIWRLFPASLYFVCVFVCFRSFYFEALSARPEVDVNLVT